MKKIFSFFVLTVLFTSIVYAGGGSQQGGGLAPGATEGGLPIVNNLLTITGISQARDMRTMSNDIRVIQELERRTNIRIEWEAFPIQASERDIKFHAIVASGDIPDLIDGGIGPNIVNRYGMQGLFLDFAPLLRQHAPNITRAFDNPLEGDLLPYDINVWGEITARDGKIYNIPLISASNAIGAVWVIRTDWLQNVGLPMPTTVNDLYTVLRAFKDQNPSRTGAGNEIPFGAGQGGRTSRILPMVNAFDAHMDLYVDYSDNRIKYGPVEPQFREALTFLNRLYSEGLIESDYLTATNAQWLARAGGNQMGIFLGWPASGLGGANNELQRLNSSFRFEPMPPIRSASGRQYKDTFITGNAVGYRTSANARTRYPVEIMRYLDYLFTPEGTLLNDFGIEGQTYNMVNGQPRYTDYIIRNPDGRDPETARVQFGMFFDLLPYQAGWSSHFQANETVAPWTVQAWRTYQSPGLVEPPMPTLGLTEMELSRRASLVAEINTFKDPWIDRFIMGQEPLSRFDEFVAGIRRAGLDELLVMLNAAYDIYRANM